MSIKLIALDIDGTIINTPKDTHVPAQIKTAINEAKRNGIFICIVSGRGYNLVRTVMEELDLTGPCICCNGAIIRDEKVIYYERYLKYDTLICCQQFADTIGLSTIYFTECGNFAVPAQGSEEVISGLKDSVEVQGSITICERRNFSETAREQDVCKVTFFVTSAAQMAEARALWEEYEGKLPEKLEVFQAFSNMFGVTPEGADKGNG